MRTPKEVIIVCLALLCTLGVVYAFQFSLISQSDFDQGTYTATTYNPIAQALQLSPENTTGNYTSKVFDGLDLSQWNSLTLNQTLPIAPLLVAVDLQDDVWISRDGVSWLFLKNDYNNGDGGNDAQFVFADFQNSLYSIESDDDVWVSTNRGLNWTKVNDDYNGEAQSVIRATADYNNNLYIIEGDEDVWKSVDGGFNWTKISTNFNGATGDVAGLVVNSSNTLLVVDLGEDIWASTDGITWSLVNSDFNGAEGTSAGYLLVDAQNFLYIIESDDDVWRSTDSGITWTKINDDYNGETQSVIRATIDYQNNFYIIEGDEDVWKSVDGGLNWTKVNGTDFNGGNGNVAGFFAINSTTNTTLQARSCNQSDCSDGIFSDTGSSLALPQNRYFQFLLSLTADEGDLTPLLFNLSIDYSDVGIPSVTAVLPQGGIFNLNNSIPLNATITDGQGIDTVLANITLPNGTIELVQLLNTSSSFYETTYTSSLVGDYLFTVFANDTSNNLNSTSSGNFSLVLDTAAPLIIPDSCTPNPSTVGEDVTCNATITDDQQVDTVFINLTLPDSSKVQPIVTNVSDIYSFIYNASQIGNVSVLWIANDSSGNEALDNSQQFTVQSSSSGGSSGSSGGSSSGSSGSDSGPDALRNAPPGTPVIRATPQPRQSPQTTPSPQQGAPSVQQPIAGNNPLTGAVVGQQPSSWTFKRVTFIFLVLASLSFLVSYFFRERKMATKYLYSNKRPRTSMVKNPEVLDKLQGYVSAEILDRLKKGDHLQQKRVDPKDKEFAHHFPETAKELQEQKIQVHPKKFNYERLEQVKRDIAGKSKVISAADMRKLFPETLGQTPRLQQEKFVLTPRTKAVLDKVVEDDFSKHYVLKQPEKLAPPEPKQAPQTSRKINKTSKDEVLKGLQEVYKIE